MKRNKIIACGISVLALCMMLTACEKQESAPTQPESTQTAQAAATPAPEKEKEEPKKEEMKESGEEKENGQEEPGKEQERSALLHPLLRLDQKDYYENGHYLITTSWDALYLEGEEAETYAALQAALREHFEENRDSNRQTAQENLEIAAEFDGPSASEWGAPFSVHDETVLQRCDLQVFSFLGKFSEYTGGAHPMYGWGGYNYDTQTGKLLSIEDVFLDPKKLSKAIYDDLTARYEEEEFWDFSSLRDTITETIEEGKLNFVLTNRGPKVFFNPYELGSFALGVMEANLYPELYPDLVKPKYRGTNDDWIMKLEAGEEIKADLNGDKRPDHVSYREIWEYDSDSAFSRIDSYEIAAGEERLTIPNAYAYASEAYLLKKGDSYFLYILDLSDNDYRTLYAIALSNGVLTYQEEENRMGGSIACRESSYDAEEESEDSYYITHYTLTDPNAMFLDAPTWFLSTTQGTRCMHAGGNGLPEPNEGWEDYRIRHFLNDLKTLQDVTGIRIDENGKEAGEYTIPAGETVRYILTDNETFGDVQTADGTIVRLYIDREESPMMINGMTLEEVFDGIIFAG